MPESVCLGWREYVAMPELGLRRIRAKIDTGARSSALHVDDQWRFERDGQPWVGFRIRPRLSDAAMEVEARINDERRVVDSGGHASSRIFIVARVLVGGVEADIELNLTSRHGMRYPMLLGRSAMQGRFIVDPARSYLHRKRRAP